MNIVRALRLRLFGSVPFSKKEMAEHQRIMSELTPDNPKYNYVEYVDLGNGCYMKDCYFLKP